MSNRYVFSYWEPLPDLDMVGEKILISLWCQQWQKAGLTPIVLNEWWASRHAIYHEFDAAVSKLPSTNPPMYERSCFMRWLAVQVAAKELQRPFSPIVMADYDALIYDPALINLWSRPKQWHAKASPPMLSLHGNCPALVVGLPEQFADVVQWFMDYKPPADLKHQSDQYLFEQMIIAQPEKFKVSMDCVLFSEPGWEKAAAVHFANSTMAPNYLPKHKHIPALRPL